MGGGSGGWHRRRGQHRTGSLPRGAAPGCRGRSADECADLLLRAASEFAGGVLRDDVAVVAIVDKLIKQRKDSIAAFEQAARQDLADKEKAEMAVLLAYLPARMSAEEVTAAVQAIVAELGEEMGKKVGPGDMGKVMGAVKAQLAGKADMGQVSAAVKAALAG